MFLLLKRLVFKVNQQSMDYFLDKLKVYDKLINDKENKLKELNELIDNKEKKEKEKEEKQINNNSPVFLYDLKNLSYKDDDIFKKMKEVNNKFNFDDKEIILNFLQNKIDKDTITDYNNYYRVRKILNQDVIFDLLTKKESKQKEEVRKLLGELEFILDDYMKRRKEFNLKQFVTYINKKIDNLDPYIYIYVGNKNENYNDLDKYIKTKYDDSIFKGIKIIYRGKLYDYSI